MTEKTLKEFVALVSIMAHDREEFFEKIDALDCYEIEWWKQINSNRKEAIK